MELVGERRAAALVRAVACSDFALRRAVWLRLIDSSLVQRRGGDDGWRIQKKKAREEATQYDMTGAACSVVGVAAAWRLGQLCAENVSGSAGTSARQRRAVKQIWRSS